MTKRKQGALRRYPWVCIPRMEMLLAEIRGELTDAEHSEDKPIIVLSGPTGIGKTALLRELAFRITSEAKKPRSHDPHFRFKPFVHAVLSTGAGPAQVAIDIRLCMGLPTATSHYRVAQHKTKEGLEQLSATVLAVDHVNSILNHGVRSQEDCLNVLKYLSVTAAIPIVLAGTMQPKAMFTHLNDPAGEMEGRAVYFRMDHWQPNADFQRLLIALGEAYGLDDPEELAGEEFASLIYKRSAGLTRPVCRGIRKAARLAREEGCSLQLRHFEVAFAQMRPC